MKKQKILILLCVSAVIVAMTSCDKDRDNTVHAVTFNADGGIPAPVAQQVKAGKTAAEPAAMTKEGYEFRFWSHDGTTAYDYAAPVKGDLTLIAIWEPVVRFTTTFYGRLNTGQSYFCLAGSGQAVIDWGDGSPKETVTLMPMTDGEMTEDNYVGHTWAADSGTKNVAITGNITGMMAILTSLTSLDVDGISTLEFLDCDRNFLETLDVSGCSSLAYLDCYYNSIETLNVSGCTELEFVDCSLNYIETLDVSDYADLVYLNCSRNYIGMLNVAGCDKLERLVCRANLLESIDISDCHALKYLVCDYNPFKKLSVIDCITLIELWCDNCSLETLDVSGCTALEYLHCPDNSLDKLNITGCGALRDLRCFNCQMSKAALEEVFAALPVRQAADNAIIFPNNNPGYDTADISILTAKNWNVQ